MDAVAAMLTSFQLVLGVINLAIAHPLVSLGALLVASPVVLFWSHRLFSPLRHLPGPACGSVLFGNLSEILDDQPGHPETRWSRLYGGAFKVHTYFGGQKLVLTDPSAISHVLSAQAPAYEKPAPDREAFKRMAGQGSILVADGADHARMRKMMAPAFSTASLKEMDSIWWDAAARLRDEWVKLVEKGETDRSCCAEADEYAKHKADGEMILDPQHWLSRATLDVIGLAGFGYSFDALDPTKSNKLADAFAALVAPRGTQTKVTPLGQLTEQSNNSILSCVPWLVTCFPSKRVQAIQAGLAAQQAESRAILDQRTREEEEGGGGKDVLSRLLAANRSESKLKMSEQELLAQMTTLIFVGHETTAISLAFALLRLAEHPHIQEKLREECTEATERALASGKNKLDGESIRQKLMPYLDAFTRECFRFDPSVPSVGREAIHDDLIPLQTPIDSATGETLLHLPIKKGQAFDISIRAANFDKTVFGDDADEFRPERWLEGNVGEKVAGPGVFSQLMTFLEGPRACSGYRLTIAEFKAIIVTLVSTFAFEKRDERTEVRAASQGTVVKPYVVEEENLGYRLPLKIKTRSVV